MRKTYTYVCSKGHLVKAAGSQVNIDSLCGKCKRLAREQQWRQNPFFAGTWNGEPTYWIDTMSRLDRVRRFNAWRCRRALQVKGLQKTVRTALERRLRKLEAKP